MNSELIEQSLLKRAKSEFEVEILKSFVHALQMGNTVCQIPNVESNHLFTFQSKINEIFGFDEPAFIQLDDKTFQTHRLYHQEIEIVNYFKNLKLCNHLQGLRINEELINKLSNKQTNLKKAVEGILKHSKIILTGGPGTGKTYTIVRMIASILGHTDLNSTDIALSAPTGKAAQRMMESIANNVENAELDKSIIERFPTAGITLHRLLGIQNDPTKATFNSKNKLPYKLLIIDEASMIDINLMSALVDALDADTQLLLVGDEYQLPSVDAGNVLNDLLQIASMKNYPIETITLDKSYRFDDDKGIGLLSKSIKVKDLDGVIASFDSREVDFVSLNTQQLRSEVFSISKPHIQHLQNQESPQTAFNDFDTQMILSPMRLGYLGTSELNKMMSSNLKSTHLLPYIINQNNYHYEVYNGDIGILEQKGEYERLHFFENKRLKKKIPFQIISSIADLALSLTIHKAQGSEYNRIVLLIDNMMNTELMTNALIYTGITRAKERVTILGDKELFLKSIKNEQKRKTGLVFHAQSI